jgi:phage-related protein
MYVAKFEEAVYVLHAFQKKSSACVSFVVTQRSRVA